MSDGNTDEAKGRVKEAAGSLTGDDSLKNEGKVDRAAQEQTKAQEDRAQANDAAASEGRHSPPDSAVPGYIKTPSKENP